MKRKRSKEQLAAIARAKRLRTKVQNACSEIVGEDDHPIVVDFAAMLTSIAQKWTKCLDEGVVCIVECYEQQEFPF